MHGFATIPSGLVHCRIFPDLLEFMLPEESSALLSRPLSTNRP